MTAATESPFLDELRQKGVCFILPVPYDASSLYVSVCLAEGLAELGIPVRANVDAAPMGETGYRFTATPRHPAESAIVVVDISAIDSGLDLNAPYQLLRTLPCRVAALCRADTLAEIAPPIETPADIPTFAAHSSKFAAPAGWRIPWAFGLSNDVLKKIDAAHAAATTRTRSFVRDFRPSHNQGVRQALDLAFVKPLAQHFAIDRRLDEAGRFVLAHYARLCGALGCLAYGGTFVEDYRKNEAFRKPELKVAPLSGDGPFVARWDSWRFWESLAAGCVTVALDFAEYGFNLPVMPENGVRYIGLRFDRLDEAIEMLAAGGDRLSTIAEAGRAWALEHYAPKPVAERFIAEIAKVTR